MSGDGDQAGTKRKADPEFNIYDALFNDNSKPNSMCVRKCAF